MKRLLLIVAAALCVHISHAQTHADTLISELRDKNCERVFVVSHRGDWRGAPENSLLAIQNCINLGVDMVEIDLCRTKDGELILMHDKTLNRTTTGKGAPEDFTLAELKELYLRNGAAVKTRHRIATLREALTLAKGKILVYIDKRVQDYLDDVYAIMEETGTTSQCIIPCSSTYDEVCAMNPEALKKMNFIPVVNLTGSRAVEMIDGYAENYKPLFFGTKFEKENSTVLELLNRIRQHGAKILINTLSSDLCAGRDDDRAVEDEDYDGSWGWVLARGASLIQTDRARDIIPYLKNQHDKSGNHIYVDLSLERDGDGSLFKPFKSLKNAIDAAEQGDTLLITQGIVQVPNQCETFLEINKNLTLIGGYDVSFSTCDGVTYIDADCNALHTVRTALNSKVTLKNFAIQGGYASASDGQGGGIVNLGKLTLENCEVCGNKCSGGAGGGGIYSAGSLKLINSKLANNYGYGDGGAVYCDGAGSLLVECCVFDNNQSKSGSAIFVKNASTVFISGCSFTQNRSQTYGTVTFYNKSFTGETVIVNNTFANNELAGYSGSKMYTGGAAVYWYGDEKSTLSLVNNTIVGNKCDAKNESGGVADKLGGAVMVRTGAVNSHNNIIAGNSSLSGFGDMFISEDAAATTIHDIFTAKENINIAANEKCHLGLSRIEGMGVLSKVLSGSVEQDKFTANPAPGITGTYMCAINNPFVNESLRINSLTPDDMKEANLLADIDCDGETDGTLVYDQQKEKRDLNGNACIGSCELLHEISGLPQNLQDEGVSIKKNEKDIVVDAPELRFVNILDSNGLELRNITAKNKVCCIDTKLLPAGFYILQIFTKDSNKSYKILI